MNANDILDRMDDLMDTAPSLPLSGGRCVLDAERMRELIDELRLNLPQEIKQAKMIVNDRKTVLEDAKKQAEATVKVAEERAARLVDENEITKRAKERANEIITTAQTQSKELKRAANDFSENLLKAAEQTLTDSLSQVRTAKAALRSPIVK